MPADFSDEFRIGQGARADDWICRSLAFQFDEQFGGCGFVGGDEYRPYIGGDDKFIDNVLRLVIAGVFA